MHDPVHSVQVICTMFFISGIITLLQTVFGDRLPIIQVHASRNPAFACKARKQGAGESPENITRVKMVCEVLSGSHSALFALQGGSFAFITPALAIATSIKVLLRSFQAFQAWLVLVECCASFMLGSLPSQKCSCLKKLVPCMSLTNYKLCLHLGAE